MDIRIEAISHKYRKTRVPVLDGVTHDFCSGCIHGIFGDNGTGKTTLLRLVAGLEPLQKGAILVGGQSVTLSRVRSEGIVYVASKPVVLTGSVLHNATVALVSRGMSREEASKRVEPLMQRLDLWRLRDQLASTLSSGEGQKLAIIRAIALNPKVLLVDEPTGNVDVAMTEQAEEMIRALVLEQGATVILVSHDLEQLKRMSDKSWRMRVGGHIAMEEVGVC